MKTRTLALAALTCLTATSIAIADNYSGTIAEIQPNHETYDCFYFRLDGVTTVVPASSGGWFSIRRNALGAKDAYAAILTARVTGQPIRVITGTTMACGHAEALFIQF